MESNLIKRAVENDPEALTKLIDAYKDIAYNIALSIVHNKLDAQDITQESFLKVFINISRFRNESGFSTWLYRIVYNESLQHLKKMKKLNGLDVNLFKNEYYACDGKNALDEKYLQLYDQIDKLNELDRSLITLFYLAEKSMKEISSITGMSLANIKVHLHRIRKRIAQNLNFTYES